MTVNGGVSRHLFLFKPRSSWKSHPCTRIALPRFLFPLPPAKSTLFFPRGSLPYEYSLTHCFVARAALTLVFSTRLHSRSFFSSPVTPTSLDRSYVRTLLIGYIRSYCSPRFSLRSYRPRSTSAIKSRTKIIPPAARSQFVRLLIFISTAICLYF